MKNKINFFVLLFFCLLFVDCNKNNDIDYIIGEWKLNSVMYIDTTSMLDGYYRYEMDLSDNNVIYNFKKNNKLVITNFVSEKSSKSQHSYKYHKIFDCPTCDPFANLQIDATKYYCKIVIDSATMSISGFSKTEEPIDEIDLAVIEKGGAYWEKSFVKLK